MKTLESVTNELHEVKQLGKESLSKKEARQLEKQIKHLYSCQLYLETKPTPEFIEKQREDVKFKIKVINDGFSTWCSNNPKERDSVSNPKSKYNSLMGLKGFKSQLVTLNYLLS